MNILKCNNIKTILQVFNYYISTNLGGKITYQGIRLLFQFILKHYRIPLTYSGHRETVEAVGEGLPQLYVVSPFT